VIVLYEEYNSGNLLLLARDRYLFLKKSKSERLASGTDTLLRWIRLVELAIKSYERFHRQTQQYAERFFRSFREQGRKKLQESIQANLAQGILDPLLEGGEQVVASGTHSQRTTRST